MELQQQMAALFDAVADTYDTVGVDFFRPIATSLLDALAPRPGERALDVGCGRGAVLLPLAGRVAPGGSAVGIDVSPRMVEATTADVARAGLVAEVLVGDAMAPELPAASFDVVASSLVLFFLPDPLAALQAWRGLLVDGGRAGVTTFGPVPQEWADNVDVAMAAVAQEAGAPKDARAVGGPFDSDDGMEQLFTDAGFRDVRTVTTKIAPRFDDADHWYRWSMSVGQRRFWQLVPAEHLDTVRARIGAAVERCRMPDGRIGFDQEIRITLGHR
jgi:ubiquinone/menaquinone biosynthesis C-methylase UbiE